MITVVALVAGGLTTGAWLPQIWRTWRTRSAEDLSWGYLFVTACGMGTWLTYGLLADDPAVIATNVATSMLIFALSILKACLMPLPTPPTLRLRHGPPDVPAGTTEELDVPAGTPQATETPRDVTCRSTGPSS